MPSKKHGNKGRKPTEKQLEQLEKGRKKSIHSRRIKRGLRKKRENNK